MPLAAEPCAGPPDLAAGWPAWESQAGPLPASELPGVHHVPRLALADLLTRFKTRHGFRVTSGASWSCHGLPVEVAVENELGISGRAAIEQYGVAEFTTRCREYARRHVAQFTAFAERIGCGPELSLAPMTMDPARVEAAWAALTAAFSRGQLVRQTRISPYCPRCETVLAGSEQSGPLAYRVVDDPMVIARFRLTSAGTGRITGAAAPGPRHAGADLLVATTEPWTLPANAAVAVHPRAAYVIARRSGHRDLVIVADGQFARLLGEGWYVVAKVSGADLDGAAYQPAFDLAGSEGTGRVTTGRVTTGRVITSTFVKASLGTGLVHLAPAFSTAAFAAAQALGLLVANPIRPDGRFDDQLPIVAGRFFSTAGPALIRDLADRGLLFSATEHRHRAAHCPHCGARLLRTARPAWYLRPDVGPDGQPGPDGQAALDGRPGPDEPEPWAVSRTRFWGTPLPIWECASGHLTCAGSLAELGGLAGTDLSGLDPHRPQIDDVIITCPGCGSPGYRVPEVVDARYDAAVPPLAPVPLNSLTSRALPDPPVPLVTSAAVRATPVLDSRGRVMSCGAGNVTEPGPLLDRYGSDAMRWLCTVTAAPEAGRQLRPENLAEISGRILERYRNAALWFARSAANAGQGGPRAGLIVSCLPPQQAQPVLDRWLLSEVNRVVLEVTTAFESGDPVPAGRQLERLIADLAGWYLRRSRERLDDGPDSPDGAAAFATFHLALDTLTRLMAPIAPAVTDYVWGLIRTPEAPDSVHLCPWPVPDLSAIDETLSRQMIAARKLVRLGRSARVSAGITAVMPLKRAYVNTDRLADLPPELQAEVASELRVAKLVPARQQGTPTARDLRAARRRDEAIWLDPVPARMPR